MPVLINRPISVRPYQVARPQPQATGCACGGCGCSACGGLECFCRPRFFAGQLLTDEDLNRLDRYITGKERLHNRYLHGWGVVCGLEVVCDPCDGYVTVRAGYALSPCGDDIIVCEDDSVNICDLLQGCHDDASDCQPLRPYSSQGNCQDVGNEWELVICYDEKATRGIMPLRNPKQSSSCSSCGCGGSKQKGQSCGCGCHSQSNYSQSNGMSSTRTKSAKPVPAQCEPTSTCETYHFELRRVASLRKGSYSTKPSRNTLVDQAAFVLEELRASVPPPPTTTTRVLWQNWYSNVRGVFQDAILRYGGSTCSLNDDFSRVPYPNPAAFESDSQWVRAVSDNVKELTRITASYLQPLICAALLPPCPPPAKDNCVPLAKLVIDPATCRVREICNVGVRRLVISFPLIEYWLSLVTKGVNWGAIFERLCCTPQLTDYVRVKGFGTVQLEPAGTPNTPIFTEQPRAATAASSSAERATTTGGVFTPGIGTSPLLGLFRNANARQSEPVNAYMLLLDALGAVDDNNNSLISSLERANPIESLLMNQVLFPALNSYVTQDRPAPGTPPATSGGDGNAAEIKDLRAMMEKQQEMIEALRHEVENLRSNK